MQGRGTYQTAQKKRYNKESGLPIRLQATIESTFNDDKMFQDEDQHSFIQLYLKERTGALLKLYSL